MSHFFLQAAQQRAAAIFDPDGTCLVGWTCMRSICMARCNGQDGREFVRAATMPGAGPVRGSEASWPQSLVPNTLRDAPHPQESGHKRPDGHP